MGHRLTDQWVLATACIHDKFAWLTGEETWQFGSVVVQYVQAGSVPT